MNWILPAEVGQALAAIVALLAAAQTIAWIKGRRRPDRDYSELRARITTWWWIVGLFAASLALGTATAILFFALASMLAFREFAALAPPSQANRNVLWWAYAGAVVQYAWVYAEWYGMFIIFVPVYMFLLIPLRAIVAGETRDFVHDTTALHWGLMATVFSVSHAAYLLVLEPGSSPRLAPHWPSEAASRAPGFGLVVFLLVLTELNDVAQYVWGKSLGRAKIVPRVSPNKTWAGFVGGVATTMLAAAALGPWLTPMDWRGAIAAGALIAACGFVGDLTISMIKRDLGVKDTGSLLPGHGGILDRIDSLTYSAPVFFHFVYYLYF